MTHSYCIGSRVKSCYGWGELMNYDSSTGMVSIELPWGQLYGSTSSIISWSVGPVGTCYLTKYGIGVLTAFRESDEMHEITLWNGSAVAYMNKIDILEQVCGCEGETVITPYGLGKLTKIDILSADGHCFNNCTSIIGNGSVSTLIKYTVQLPFGVVYILDKNDILGLDSLILPCVNVIMSSIGANLKSLKTNLLKFSSVFEKFSDGSLNFTAAYSQIMKIMESKEINDKMNETWQQQRQNLIDNLVQVKSRIVKLIEETDVTESLTTIKQLNVPELTNTIKYAATSATSNLSNTINSMVSNSANTNTALNNETAPIDSTNNGHSILTSKHQIDVMIKELTDNSTTLLNQSLGTVRNTIFGEDSEVTLNIDIQSTMKELLEITQHDPEMQSLVTQATQSYTVCKNGWLEAKSLIVSSVNKSDSGKLLMDGTKQLQQRWSQLTTINNPTAAGASNSNNDTTPPTSPTAMLFLETVTQQLQTQQGQRTLNIMKDKLLESVSQLSLDSLNSNSQDAARYDQFSNVSSKLASFLPGHRASTDGNSGTASSITSMLYDWFSSLYNSTKKDNALFMLIGDKLMNNLLSTVLPNNSSSNTLLFPVNMDLSILGNNSNNSSGDILGYFQGLSSLKLPTQQQLNDIVKMRLSELLINVVLLLRSTNSTHKNVSSKTAGWKETFPNGNELLMLCKDPLYGVQRYTMHQLSLHGHHILTSANEVAALPTNSKEFNEIISPLLLMLEQIIPSDKARNNSSRGRSSKPLLSASSSSSNISSVLSTAITTSLSSSKVTSLAQQLLSVGDGVLDSLESIRNSDTVTSALQQLQSGQLQQSLLQQLQDVDHSSALNLAEQALVDKDARVKLIAMLQNKLIDFVSSYLPSLTIPAISGVQDEVEYYVNNLNLSGFQLNKDGISFSIAEDLSGQNELLKFQCKGINAKFLSVIWNYSQLFFPHLSGSGLADINVINACVELEFKIARCPKGVSLILSDGGLDSQQKLSRLGERFPSVVSWMNQDEYDSASNPSTPASTTVNIFNNGNIWNSRKGTAGAVAVAVAVAVADADAAAVSSAALEEWEPILLLSKRSVTIDNLTMTIENNSLSWLYNMLINIFSNIIKEYVCSQLELNITESTALLLSPLNNIVSYNWKGLQSVINIPLLSLPIVTLNELYGMVGAEATANSSGKVNRDYVLKFTDTTPLGLKLDIAKKTVMNQFADKLTVIGIVKGSQAESVVQNLKLPERVIVNAQIRSVNGKSIVGLSSEAGLMELRGPRPLHVTVRLSDIGYNILLTSRMMENSNTNTANNKSVKVPAISAPVTPTMRSVNNNLQQLNQTTNRMFTKMNVGVNSLIQQVQQGRPGVGIGGATANEGAVATNNKQHRRKLPVTKAVFGAGPLGLKLRESKSCGGAVIVSGFSRSETGELLQAELLGTLFSGMIMLSIGEVIVFGKSFDSVMTILKATPRPVSMLFTKSPDAQVLLTECPQDLFLQKVNGEIVVAATCRLYNSPSISSNSSTVCGDAEAAVAGNQLMNELKPGHVIIQVNQTRITPDCSVEDVFDCIRICCQSCSIANANSKNINNNNDNSNDNNSGASNLLSNSSSCKVAVRDMDAFVHLIKLRDGVETLLNDVDILQ